MSDISLRAYHRKIENWIEENNLDKAIPQISYLLEIFPKNLKSWQLLSKALLQESDFLLADRVFDVVLEIDPDDFVSHIGKSMAAENRNDLAQSIEHMRRAFEIQPSNEGLQNELKRLIQKKDCVEPNKIRLTRGALVKMYFRGGLYEQSAAEAEIGLHENPNRIDFLLTLAESLKNTGNLIRAVETSVKVIRELPYCLKANEILQSILDKSLKKELADNYQNRLIELDPYYAFMLPTTQSVHEVPDIAVMVEDRSEASDQPVDIELMIINSWTESKELAEPAKSEPSKNDWEEIIRKAVSEPEIKMELDGNQFEEVSAEESQSSDVKNGSDTHLSRKAAFLEKLKPASQKSDTSIPEWIFDVEGDLKKNIVQNGFQPSLSSIVNDSSDQDRNRLSEDRPTIYDADAESALPEEFSRADSKSNWVSEAGSGRPNEEDKKIIQLDDTQEIKILDEDPMQLLDTAEKALQGGNTQYAVKVLFDLVSSNKLLDQTASRLEYLRNIYPDTSELYILLGKTYTKLGKQEEALTEFKKAQKFISL